MNKIIFELSNNNRHKNRILAHPPSICPQCHNSIAPKFEKGLFIADDYAQLLFQCTHQNCRKLFISSYNVKAYDSSNPAELIDSQPTTYKKESFSGEIQGISINFIKIYNQAIQALSMSMEDIAGVGLRKSIEFLIKDFAIVKNPKNEEEIKRKLLSQCINDYIEDSRIKKLSKLAVWLGNDETHYVRKWEQKDIKDLKILIKLVVNYIENDILSDQYLQDMSD